MQNIAAQNAKMSVSNSARCSLADILAAVYFYGVRFFSYSFFYFAFLKNIPQRMQKSALYV